MCWKHSSSPPPKKAMVISFAEKAMASLWWMQKQCVHWLFSKKSHGERRVVCQLAGRGDKKRCFELDNHPPYSAPTDSHLLLSIKRHLAEKQYCKDDVSISAVGDLFFVIRTKASSPIGCKYCL